MKDMKFYCLFRVYIFVETKMRRINHWMLKISTDMDAQGVSEVTT